MRNTARALKVHDRNLGDKLCETGLVMPISGHEFGVDPMTQGGAAFAGRCGGSALGFHVQPRWGN